MYWRISKKYQIIEMNIVEKWHRMKKSTIHIEIEYHIVIVFPHNFNLRKNLFLNFIRSKLVCINLYLY